MTGSADEILKRPYRRVLVPDPDSGACTAMIAEFPGCIAEGESPAEALANLERIGMAWVESLLARGVPIPSLVEGREYSGRFALRLPRSLHESAARLAEEDGVSLNTFLISAIAERIGRAHAPGATAVAADRSQSSDGHSRGAARRAGAA